MDAALIAHECVDTRLRGMDPGVMCKLDIEKAYAHLNWNFQLSILRQMGFGSRWLCIKTTKFLILVNGESAVFFSAERGLIQGDPLSPFLFIVTMEDSNSILKIATQSIWLQGFRIGKWADETL